MEPKQSRMSINIPNSQGAPGQSSMDNIVKMMKQLDLYKEGDNVHQAFNKYKNMSTSQVNQHLSKLRSKRSQEEARESGPHEESWWFMPEHPER